MRKSQKGKCFTADYIPYERATLKGNELLYGNQWPVIGFYIIFSINTGLRVGDVLKLRHPELSSLRPGEYLRVTESKTGKVREIQVNDKIIDAYRRLAGKLVGRYAPGDFIFTSRKGGVYATESLNVILKKIFAGYAPHISTHSLRKSFGRHVYEMNGRSEDSLVKLSELFRHTCMAVTRRYLGIRREELGSIYMNL
ncbi:Tyrosine recombinase XerC [subsurface metagenome]